MKNLKYIVWALVVLAWMTFAYFNFVVNPTNANPDYICVKSVDRTCEVDEKDCGDWSENWTRTCTWKKVTKVGYYHTRTACESGYSVEKTWNTASSNTAARFADQSTLDAEWKAAKTKHPSSWRHSDDFVYWTENCSIKQVDEERPSWEVEQIN